MTTPAAPTQTLEQVRYAVLAQENSRLQAEIDRHRDRVDALRKAGNALAVAAQTAGGTAARDDGLVAAIEAWTAAAGPQPSAPRTFGDAP